MAKKQVVSYSYTCDVCGTTIPGSEGDSATRKVSWEGTDYVLDVCEAHGSQLVEVLDQLRAFVEAGTRAGGRRGRRSLTPASTASVRSPRGRRRGTSSSSGTAPKRGDLGEVRSWARANGMKVSERGRIPAALLEAYDAANKAPGDTPAPPTEPAAKPESAPVAKKTSPRKRSPRKAKAPATAAAE